MQTYVVLLHFGCHMQQRLGACMILLMCFHQWDSLKRFVCNSTTHFLKIKQIPVSVFPPAYRKLILFNKSRYFYRFAILGVENQHLGGQVWEEAEMDLPLHRKIRIAREGRSELISPTHQWKGAILIMHWLSSISNAAQRNLYLVHSPQMLLPYGAMKPEKMGRFKTLTVASVLISHSIATKVTNS